jgi:hypothetical protein
MSLQEAWFAATLSPRRSSWIAACHGALRRVEAWTWLEEPGLGWRNPDLVGGTRIWLEQLGLGWSNSDLVGATRTWLEQLGLGWSNSDLVGATRTWLEQLGFGWSNSDLVGATRIWLEQLGLPLATGPTGVSKTRLGWSNSDCRLPACDFSPILQTFFHGDRI